MLDTLPSPKERELALHAPIQENKNFDASTYRIKEQLSKPDVERE